MIVDCMIHPIGIRLHDGFHLFTRPGYVALVRDMAREYCAIEVPFDRTYEQCTAEADGNSKKVPAELN